MNSIIGILKYSKGFYAISKYQSQPTEKFPLSIFKYALINLIWQQSNLKTLIRKLLLSLPYLSRRDIIYLNLASPDEYQILVYGGAEKTSVGEIQIKEIYLLFDDSENNNECQCKGLKNEEGCSQKQIRLDDLKNGVGRAQLFRYELSSKDYRFFDFENLSDDECDDCNIPERSELDEDDLEQEQGEEEVQQVNPINMDEVKKERHLEKTTEYFVIDQRSINISYFKRQISVQIIKSDNSIKQRYISLKVNQGINLSNSFSVKSKFPSFQSNIFKNEVYQYIPLSESLIIGMNIESQSAFLISMVSFKATTLNIINDVLIAQQIQPENVKQLSQKFYFKNREKSFLYIYQSNFDLICNTYEFDSEKISLHLISQMIILPNYGCNQQQNNGKTSPNVNEENQSKNNKIFLPQLTLSSTKSEEEPLQTSQNNKINSKVNINNQKVQEILQTLSSYKALTSAIQKISEISDDDEPLNKQENIQKESNQKNQTKEKFNPHQQKMRFINQKDTLVESNLQDSQFIGNDQREDQQRKKNIEKYSMQDEEEEKQELNDQMTTDLLSKKIHQNQNILFLEKSIEISPETMNGSSQVPTFQFNQQNQEKYDQNVDNNGNKTLFNIKDIPLHKNQQNYQNEIAASFQSLQPKFNQNEQNNLKSSQIVQNSQMPDEIISENQGDSNNSKFKDINEREKVNKNFIKGEDENSNPFLASDTHQVIQNNNSKQYCPNPSNQFSSQEDFAIQKNDQGKEELDDFNIIQHQMLNISSQNISIDENQNNILMMIDQNFKYDL